MARQHRPGRRCWFLTGLCDDRKGQSRRQKVLKARLCSVPFPWVDQMFVL